MAKKAQQANTALEGEVIAPPSGGLAGRPVDLQPAYATPHSLERLFRYSDYRAWYNGDQWLGLPAPGEKRLTLNYLRVFVNKAASYLLSKPVGYNAEPTQASGPEEKQAQARRVEDYLGRVSEFNNLAALDLDEAIRSGTYGDGAYTVRWDDTEGMVRVTGVDPASVDARWRADDNRTLLWVRQTYYVMPAELTEAQGAALDLGLPGKPVDQYKALEACEDWTDKEWSLTVGGVLVDGGANPYGAIPYIIFPNLRVPGEFWGESDLCDLIGVQRELNSRVSIFSRILDVAGNPVAVISGASKDETAELRLGPNQLWTIPAGAKAEVLDLLKAGGADAHLKYIDAVYRAMHDVSEMPRTSFGDSSGQAQARSGTALLIELQPLLHKLARKQAILAAAFARRAQLILAIARLHGEALPECRITCQWPPVLPQDRAELVNQEVALVGAGIHPPTEALELLGEEDPEPVFQKVIEQGKQLVMSKQVQGVAPAVGSVAGP